ncbi:MAG TPA: xylann 1,4-beta-xylosidase [Candidatus Limiplasma sp.]|nr:xylann 1,4-beta-xylosidase [Candidatus Limiplasma sp.]
MRNLHIDLQGTVKPLDRYFAHCVGAGRAGEMLRAETLKQLSHLQDACGFRYLRFHGLFSDDMAVCTLDREGNVLYNWQYIDLVIDEMLEHRIRPLVELGFMPDCLKSGEQTIFWWKGNVTPPRDMAKWQDLVAAFTRHVTGRYGADEVRTWYFEVWNEPNLSGFFTGTQADYFALYDASTEAVKSVDPAYRVGGPGTAGLAEGTWIAELIAHCAEHRVPIDFVSTHGYGVDGHLDEFGSYRHTLKKDQDCVIKDVQKARDAVQASSLPDLPVIFTEWSNSHSSRDNVHDSYVTAPFILYTLKRCQGIAQSMSYWTFTDIFEEAGPGPAPFHGGFGLMNIQGLCKPSFYAYRWLCELPENELATQDADSYAAMDDSSLHVLLWDYTHPRQDTDNQEYFIRDLPAKALDDVSVELEGMPGGDYTVETYRVGHMANDVYTAYLRAGYRELIGKETPTREQIEALREHTSGRPESTNLLHVGEDGGTRLILHMRQNDVIRIILHKNTV